VAFKKIYAEPDPAIRHDKLNKEPIDTIVFGMETGEIFDPDSRTMKVKPYIDKVFRINTERLDNNDFSNNGPTSALLAQQLKEVIPDLVIKVAPQPASA
jgi:hypothetical protein